VKQNMAKKTGGQKVKAVIKKVVKKLKGEK